MTLNDIIKLYNSKLNHLIADGCTVEHTYERKPSMTVNYLCHSNDGCDRHLSLTIAESKRRTGFHSANFAKTVMIYMQEYDGHGWYDVYDEVYVSLNGMSDDGAWFVTEEEYERISKLKSKRIMLKHKDVRTEIGNKSYNLVSNMLAQRGYNVESIDYVAVEHLARGKHYVFYANTYSEYDYCKVFRMTYAGKIASVM